MLFILKRGFVYKKGKGGFFMREIFINYYLNDDDEYPDTLVIRIGEDGNVVLKHRNKEVSTTNKQMIDVAWQPSDEDCLWIIDEE